MRHLRHPSRSRPWRRRPGSHRRAAPLPRCCCPRPTPTPWLWPAASISPAARTLSANRDLPHDRQEGLHGGACSLMRHRAPFRDRLLRAGHRRSTAAEPVPLHAAARIGAGRRAGATRAAVAMAVAVAAAAALAQRRAAPDGGAATAARRRTSRTSKSPPPLGAYSAQRNWREGEFAALVRTRVLVAVRAVLGEMRQREAAIRAASRQ
jgi:hypothetical protein